MIIRLLLLATLALNACAAAAERDPALAGFFAAPLRIETAAGETHRFVAYLALTQQQKMRGLMHVKSLPDDYGMLFLYDRPQQISMWMKNTLLPLDMLFIRADGTIVNIVQNTVPHSLASIRSAGDASAVLELNAGTSERLGLEPGDRVIYRAFSRVSAAELPASDQR